MTNEQLRAENERLGAEVAALRTLLAAVRDLADVPSVADPTVDADWNARLALCASRLGSIATWADPDTAGCTAASAVTLHNSANRLRELAAVSPRYAVKGETGDEPAPMPTPRAYLEPAAVSAEGDGRCECGHGYRTHSTAVRRPCQMPACGCSRYRPRIEAEAPASPKVVEGTLAETPASAL